MILYMHLYALPLPDVWLVEGPVAVVLADLVAPVAGEGVGGEVVLGLHSH